MGRPDLDSVHHFRQIDPIAFRKKAPLIQKCQQRGPVGIFDNLAGFALDRTIQNGQRKLIDIQDLGEKSNDLFTGNGIDTAADPPEIFDGGHIIPPRHHTFETVRQTGLDIV